MKRFPAVAAAVFLILSCGICPAFGEDSGEDSPDELYEELSTSLTEAEVLVAGIVLGGEAPVTAEQLESLRTLNRQIRGSLYSDLIDRCDLLLLLTREQMLFQQGPQVQARLEATLRDSLQDARTRKRSAARDKVLRASLTTTLASFALAFTCWGLGEWQDRRYFESTTTEGATLHRRLFEIFSIGSMIGATAGLFGAGVTATLYAAAR